MCCQFQAINKKNNLNHEFNRYKTGGNSCCCYYLQVKSNYFNLLIKLILKMYDDSPDLVEGEMTITTGGRKTATQPGQPDFNTLDEPIKETMVLYFYNLTYFYCSNLNDFSS